VEYDGFILGFVESQQAQRDNTKLPGPGKMTEKHLEAPMWDSRINTWA